jgi:hypothetical protein
MDGLKRCSKCGQDKPRTEFYADRRAADGCRSRCKACDLEWQQQFRKDHREAYNGYTAAWRDRNAEREREKDRERARKNRAADPEKDNEYKRARYAADPGKAREYKRARYAANRQRITAQKRLGYAADPEKPRDRSRTRYETVRAETRRQARRHYYQWTGPELEIAARQDLTAKQVALMTGRTYGAVTSMRRRLRDDPKVIWLAGLDDPADAMTAPGMSFGPVA